MPELVKMPEVAANMVEAILSEWAVAEADDVEPGGTLATIETEKAIVDLEAEVKGTIVRLLARAGQTVKVGEPLALLAGPGELIDDVDAVLRELGAPLEAPAGLSDPMSASGEPARTQEPAARPADPVPPADQRLFSSPLARKLARQANLELDSIRGTGPRGRIRRRDVQSAMDARASGLRTKVDIERPTLPEQTTRELEVDVQLGAARQIEVATDGETLVPHSALRKLIASRLTDSKSTIPHFYVRGSADMTALLELRASVNASGTTRVSLNDFIVKAAAVAMTLTPEMNVIWAADAIHVFDEVDISVAVASERGLVTPVLRRVQRSSVTAISRQVKDYIERANGGTLRQDELHGGTMTISNLGMFGVEEFAAIINPPQASILAVGAIRQEPVVRAGQIEVAPIMRFTLSVDHRPLDGAIAAAWMQNFIAAIQTPLRIVA